MYCCPGPFDNNDSIHSRVLQTVYRQLTGAKLDCPRYGSHWEQIGFQGFPLLFLLSMQEVFYVSDVWSTWILLLVSVKSYSCFITFSKPSLSC